MWQRFVPAVLSLAMLSGCGGGGSTHSLIEFGYRQSNSSFQAVTLTADPVPNLSVSRPAVNAGTEPKIVIDSVAAYSGQVHPLDNSNIYQSVTQFATGRVFNVDVTKTRVIVYAQTNQFYIQPLNNSYCTIYEGNIWYAPANAGRILAVLVTNTFQAPATYSSDAPPQVDGTNILAVAQQPQ